MVYHRCYPQLRNLKIWPEGRVYCRSAGKIGGEEVGDGSQALLLARCCVSDWDAAMSLGRGECRAQ